MVTDMTVIPGRVKTQIQKPVLIQSEPWRLSGGAQTGQEGVNTLK